MQNQKQTNLVQIGGGLIVLGLVVYLVQFAAHLIAPLAGLAILAGLILLVIGLVMPNRSRY